MRTDRRHLEPERAWRFFRKGDLKLLILELLDERPRHGYDIIRALEDRFGGFHAPSPGAVYPALEMLAGLRLVTPREDVGRRVYTISDHGRDFLLGQRDTVQGIRRRMDEWWAPATREQLREAHRELKALHQVVARNGGEAGVEALARIRKVIVAARTEVEKLLEPQPESSRHDGDFRGEEVMQ